MQNGISKIAAAGFKAVNKDAAANLKEIEKICAEAHLSGADVICFPELSLCGNDVDGLGIDLSEIADYIPGNYTDALGRTAGSNNVYIVAGLLQKSRVPGRLFTTQVVISPVGEIKNIYQKTELYKTEKLYFKENILKLPQTAEFPFGRAALLMGSDIENRQLVEGLKEQTPDCWIISAAHEDGVGEKASELARETGTLAVVSDTDSGKIFMPDGSAIEGDIAGAEIRI